MFDRLAELERRYEELGQRMTDPEVLQDPGQLQKVAKAHAELEEIVSRWRAYRQVQEELAETRTLLEEKLDPEMRELAREELARLSQREAELEKELRVLLLPKDPNDEKNIIVEIRAGAGGEEAALFAADLFRMYSRYAENRGWRVEMMSASPTELGGFKEVIFMVHGKNAYSRLKYESGVHRVQRVPTTEASGRIHTSTATVAVLPEAEEVDVEIRPEDLRIDVFRSGGHGGQSVNTTDSAVRITHLPTGIVVTCQDERSQLQNREKAMRVLRARLLDMKRREQEEELAAARRSQVGTGERSERIRTYNFPQGRMTDHRIGLTLYKLDAVLQGELDEVIDALVMADQAEQLERQEAGL
ncbi:MAG TPA: peptide chain release factor 1 [Limnochordales bacterium]|nr:peptide chain release factor 1 [Limnochordales bacterium]